MIYLNLIKTCSSFIQNNKNENMPVLKQLDRDTVSFSGSFYEPGCMDQDFALLLNDAKSYNIVAQKLLQYASDDGITASKEHYDALIKVLKDPDIDDDSKIFLNQLKKDWRLKLGIFTADLRLAK